MPETNEGILFIVGAAFFLIGLIGGGLEISAIKVPPLSKIPRYLMFLVGAFLMGVALVRFMTPTAASPIPATEIPTALPVATVEQPNPTVPPPTPTDLPLEQPATRMGGRSARINDIWVDFDLVQMGMDGMLIHVDFEVDGLEGVPCGIAAYFYDVSGNWLMDANASYNSEGGQVVVFQDFTPVYPSAVFEDFELFMPYDELDLPDGEYELKFSILIWEMASGETIESWPSYYDFTYSQY
jgi:hypothetical protein